MRIKKLAPNVIEQHVPGLDGWSLEQGKLYRQFVFQDFLEAFGFMA